MSPAGVAVASVPVGVGTGGVPIAAGVYRPLPAPTGAPLACTVAGRDAHAVERIAPEFGWSGVSAPLRRKRARQHRFAGSL
jgi:hypothetical protein